MNNENNNLEQLLQVSSQSEEVSQDNINRVEEIDESSRFGKFKNAEALLEAYNNLQSDYTKKCQMLAQKQKDDKTENATAPESDSFNWAENAKDFFEKNERAKKYEDKLARIIVEDKEIAGSTNPLNNAWNKFISSKFLEEEDLVNNESFLQKYIFNNDFIKNKIIKDYFNSLHFANSPTLISSQKGSESVLSPVTKPKTIKEARKIVEDMFN